jgi:hypothetical protein
MAKIKQFTLTVQNRPGELAAVAKSLGKAKVNLLALLATVQGGSAAVQLVTQHAKRAKKALDAAGIAYHETTADEHEIANKAGALARYLEKLAAKGVNLSSLCATASKGTKKATVVYTAEARAKAASV